MGDRSTSSSKRPPVESMNGKLAATLYAELRGIARSVLREHQRPTLMQTTALLHEAWLRLRGYDASRWGEPGVQFGALAVSVLRSVLVDEARREGRDKRGGSWRRIPLPIDKVGSRRTSRFMDLLDLDQALTALAELSGRQAAIVEMRFFGGFTVEQVADMLGVSKRTVEKEWELARAWLRVRLAADTKADES